MGGRIIGNEKIEEVIEEFDFAGELTECIPYGNGHINDTYRLTFRVGEKVNRYILQRMNKSIFTDPVGLMENISGVTSWLKKKILENGGDVKRETLNLVNDKEGSSYYVDKEGEYWRVYLFIEGATCYDQVKNEDDFIKVQLLLEISSAFWRIIRRKLFMRPS